MDSLVDVVNMIEDNVAYYKHQNPTRVKTYGGDKIFSDNEGCHDWEFNAVIVVMGKEYSVSFPIQINIYLEDGEDVQTIDVEAQESEDITIEDKETGFRVHHDYVKAMEELEITFDMVDEWATKYCLK